MTTLLLVDAPLAVRQALRARLSLEPGLAIVGEADEAPLAISLAHALDPDVVLLDAEAPDLDSSELVRALAARDPERGIVVLSQHNTVLRDGLRARRRSSSASMRAWPRWSARSVRRPAAPRAAESIATYLSSAACAEQIVRSSSPRSAS